MMSEKALGIQKKLKGGEKSPAEGCVYVPSEKTGFSAIVDGLSLAGLNVSPNDKSNDESS
jgi:hypothetical protein